MGFFNKVVGSNGNGSNPQGSNLTITEFDYTNFDAAFAKTYTKTIYSKIMHECADRAMLPPEVKKDAYTLTVYDSYSPRKAGLVSLVVDAMVETKRVFYRKRRTQNDVYVFDKVNQTDALNDDGSVTDPEIIELDFREFTEAAVVCLLFQLLAEVLTAMSKNVVVSGTILLKLNKLSEMIANAQNLEPLREQVAQISTSLSEGRAAYIDGDSDLVYPSYNPEPAEKAASFIFSMISSITGIPNSWLFGEVVGGLGDSSSSDNQRMNAAMKRYFYSIYSGVVHAVFDRNFEYKQIVDDIQGLISAFAFVETTTLLTEEGKLKFMLNNTPFTQDDININTGEGGD